MLATKGIGRCPFFEARGERPDVEFFTLSERNRAALLAALCARLAR
ncbi:MAG: hypothetical protein ACE5IP_10880 [Terriglobia bacterium]